jgi:hypothetical protein
VLFDWLQETDEMGYYDNGSNVNNGAPEVAKRNGKTN